MPRIVFDLATRTTRTDFEIDDAELIGIGRVTAQWAYLEHGIYALSFMIATSEKIDLPKDALSTSFKRRLTAFRLLVEEFFKGDEREKTLRLVSRIANAEQDRHKITHAMWEWDKEVPDRIAASSFRPGFEFEKILDAAKMNKLADEIGQINFALEYPEGIKGVFADYADADGRVAYASTSRQQSRETKAGIDRHQLDLDEATPPKDTRPRSS